MPKGKTKRTGDSLGVRVCNPPDPNRGGIFGLAVCGKRIVAVGGQGHDVFMVSEDGENFDVGTCSGHGLRGACLTEERLWVAGEYGFLASSSNLGASWEKLETNTRGCLFGIVRGAEGRFFTAGDDGYLAVSKDGGATFAPMKGVDESIGRISPSPLGLIVPTDPGHLFLVKGEKVERTALEGKGGIMIATVTPKGTLLAVGDKGGLYRSTDQGKSFATVGPKGTTLYTGCDCFEDGRVVVVGGGGRILISHDDGESFDRIKQTASKGFFWCCKRYGDRILIAGDQGIILSLGAKSAEEEKPLPAIAFVSLESQIPHPAVHPQEEEEEDEDEDDEDEECQQEAIPCETRIRNASSEVYARFYALPVTSAQVDRIAESLTQPDNQDLVAAHLKGNHAYFGGVDKTLSGFVVLDDTDDNYYLLDARDTGQVFFQDHEERDISFAFGNLEKYVELQGDKASAEQRGKAKKSKLSPSTVELAERYQWLVWFLAQPMLSRGTVYYNDDSAVGDGAGHLFNFLKSQEDHDRLFEDELPLLGKDPHLAVYWLLHCALLACKDKLGRVAEATGGMPHELVQQFRAACLEPKLETLAALVPGLRERCAALLSSYSGFWRKDRERLTEVLVASLELAPEQRPLFKLSLIAGMLETVQEEALAQAMARLSANLPAHQMAQAVLDALAGKAASDPAEQVAASLLGAELSNEAVWFLNTVQKLLREPASLLPLVERWLTTDPFHYSLLNVGFVAADRAGDRKRSEEWRRRHTALTEIRPVYLKMASNRQEEQQAGMQEYQTMPEDRRRLTTRRLMAMAAQLAPQVRNPIVLAALDMPEEYASEHFASALGTSLSPYNKDLGAAIDKRLTDGRHPLVGILLKLLHLPERHGDVQASFGSDSLKEAAVQSLSKVAHDDEIFSVLMKILDDPVLSSARREIITELLCYPGKYSEFGMLDRLSDAQAAAAATKLIALNKQHVKAEDIHVFHDAGHKLFAFRHPGAQEVLCRAFAEVNQDEEDLASNLYAALRAINSPMTREKIIDRLFDEKRWLWRLCDAIEELHSPELHQQIMSRLRARKDLDAANIYASALTEFVGKKGAIDATIGELAEEVLGWETADADSRAKLYYILLEALRSLLKPKHQALVKKLYDAACAIPVNPFSLYLANDRKKAYEHPFQPKSAAEQQLRKLLA